MCVAMMTNSKTACFFRPLNRQSVAPVAQISTSPRRFETEFRNFNAEVFYVFEKATAENCSFSITAPNVSKGIRAFSYSTGPRKT
jgi:hypothetical protein